MSLNVKNSRDLAALAPNVRAAILASGIDNLECLKEPAEKAGRGQQSVGPWNPADPGSKIMLRQRLIAAFHCLKTDNVGRAAEFIADAIAELNK